MEDLDERLSGVSSCNCELDARIACFCIENYEIAAYNSLLVLAEAGGFQDPERVLKQNLSEEEAMANWLKET
ncbi:ferritin-like domain-containing protein [Mesorhizobium sp. M0045]|uniref:DUF892 family protein n=1 Tax=Mesorhizobium sp. M0045 TaxID=2956857 RepID=UPI00333A63E3